jgi:DNA-binding response OmpR family regulator
VVTSFLIVEDESNIRQFLTVNLQARGYHVLQAASAEEGLDQLRAHAPDALILDIRLPHMSGLELLDIIAADHTLRGTPVIVITASSVSPSPSQTEHINVVQWLMKPIGVQDLMRAVNQAIRT